jgi:hypothetical protein
MSKQIRPITVNDLADGSEVCLEHPSVKMVLEFLKEIKIKNDKPVVYWDSAGESHPCTTVSTWKRILRKLDPEKAVCVYHADGWGSQIVSLHARAEVLDVWGDYEYDMTDELTADE